jgi:uncharacterized membrane protein YfcA
VEIIGALFAGAIMGAILGFVGAGGAMLSVPMLMYGFGFDPKQATTASLAIVFLAAASGAIPKVRRHQILYRDAFTIWSIGLTTNIGFTAIAHRLSDSFITTGFSLVLFAAGASMVRTPNFGEHKRMPIPLLVFTSLIIGAMTGLFGIGGGFLTIPVLVLFFGTPQAIAAGTSLMIIALNSLTAFAGRLHMWSDVQWHIPIFMGVAAIIVTQITSHQSHAVHPIFLRRGFAVSLFAIALFTLGETWI